MRALSGRVDGLKAEGEVMKRKAGLNCFFFRFRVSFVDVDTITFGLASFCLHLFLLLKKMYSTLIPTINTVPYVVLCFPPKVGGVPKGTK